MTDVRYQILDFGLRISKKFSIQNIGLKSRLASRLLYVIPRARKTTKLKLDSFLSFSSAVSNGRALFLLRTADYADLIGERSPRRSGFGDLAETAEPWFASLSSVPNSASGILRRAKQTEGSKGNEISFFGPIIPVSNRYRCRRVTAPSREQDRHLRSGVLLRLPRPAFRDALSR